MKNLKSIKKNKKKNKKINKKTLKKGGYRSYRNKHIGGEKKYNLKFIPASSLF